MSIISKLQNQRLGLIELSALGYKILLQHPKTYLLVFCTILLPFIILGNILSINTQNNPSGLAGILIIINTLVLFFAQWVYFVAIAVITENIVYNRSSSYRSVNKKIFANFKPIVGLTIRYTVVTFLRSLLLLVPGIIYVVNNQYYGLACVLRDQKGKASFNYSRSIVKGNWWKVFFFGILIVVVSMFLGLLLGILLVPLLPILPLFWINFIAQTLPSFFVVGLGISSILLFMNLEFQQGVEPVQKQNLAY